MHWLPGKQAISDRVGFKSARDGGRKSDMLKGMGGGKKKERHTEKERRIDLWVTVIRERDV